MRVGVAFRVPVEELAQERPARALDLRDEHQRLPNLHQMLQPDPGQRAVLLQLAQLLPRGRLGDNLRRLLPARPQHGLDRRERLGLSVEQPHRSLRRLLSRPARLDRTQILEGRVRSE